MGPQEPAVSSRPGGADTDQKKRRAKFFLIGSLVLLAGLMPVAAWFAWQKKQDDENKLVGFPENAATSHIDALKNTKDIKEKQILISSYMATKNYAEAAKLAKTVADQTKKIEDYITLLNICTQYDVPNKQVCIDEVAAKLLLQIKKLSFYNAYVIATTLDGAGQGKTAIDFYQRAYSVYDPKRVDEFTKTKAQIKARIDELRG